MYTSKDYRIIKRHLCSFFSTSGYLTYELGNDKIGPDFFHPSIELKARRLYLSEKTIYALKIICEIILKDEEINSNSTYNDIYQITKKSIAHFLELNTKPSEKELIQHITLKAEQKIKNYNFICKISGLELTNLDEINLAEYRISMFSECGINHLSRNELSHSTLVDNFSNHYIISGCEKGTIDSAKIKFYQRCDILLSITFLYSCLLFKHAFSLGKLSLEKKVQK